MSVNGTVNSDESLINKSLTSAIHQELEAFEGRRLSVVDYLSVAKFAYLTVRRLGSGRTNEGALRNREIKETIICTNPQWQPMSYFILNTFPSPLVCIRPRRISIKLPYYLASPNVIPLTLHLSMFIFEKNLTIIDRF